MAFPRAIDKSKDNSARRVVKQGLFHICGMCSTRYGSEAKAEACLKSCIKRYMDQSAVQDHAEKTHAAFRCTYCKRVYEKLIQAKECARSCKDNIQKKIDTEARLKKSQTVDEKLKRLAAFAGGAHNLPPVKNHNRAEAPQETRKHPKEKKTPPPGPPSANATQQTIADASPSQAKAKTETPTTLVHPAEGKKFETEGKLYKCNNCQQKYKKFQEAIACYDRHREQEQAGVTLKKPGDEKFFRDGAKYVCKQCSKKWFSRGEVIACFEGHEPEEDVWITGGPQESKPKGEATAPAGKETLDQLRVRRATARSEGEKFFRDGAKYVCRICSKKLFTKPEVIQCYDSHSAEEGGTADDTGPTLTTQDLELPALEKSAPKVKAGNSRDGQDKFYRDGAKYVCKKCNGRYFTRNEVIQCFDKH